MHATALRLASHSRSTALALLPPLQLYRRLLRTHRKKLPAEMRVLGDEYVKSEFRLHKDIDNPAHIVGFLTEWQLYAQALEGDTWKGQRLEKEKIEKMSDEQVGQLYELMRNIKGLGEGQGEGDEGQSKA
ncbi:hypothetical protein FN846DRAFT_719964 [Sphaerosporella brunnea]|uniref:Succinate dehydrogenase assembly factor 3 n=1 Tax=Sphaerosporella brunnea TaxID=1250544 RepID=A0A5J5EXB0_9PEZI|nr:hypothetical protein FN846DRAFT_719964 [Sphaerosporella brunnea]